MARLAFCLVLLSVAAYLFLNGYHFWAILCVVWAVYLALRNWLARVFSVLSRLQGIHEEHDCNALLHCRFDVEKALAHRSVENLYDSLHAEGTVAAATFQDWILLLVENYKRKYKRDTTVEEVRFNVKNSVVFKNGEPDFWTDTIYHAFDIPYVYSEGQEPSGGLFVPSDEKELSLRLFIVNGHLKLQVGEFSKRHSPRVLRGGSLAVYENWATVTSFPLMYFSSDHGLPVRCLNLSSGATDSYKEHVAGRRKPGVKGPFWKRAPDMFADWSALHRDVAAYRVLCDSDSEYVTIDTISKLAKVFETRREKPLKEGGFKTWQRHDSEDWRYPDHGHEYWSEFLWLHFQNLSKLRDYAEEHWWTDYYEEQP